MVEVTARISACRVCLGDTADGGDMKAWPEFTFVEDILQLTVASRACRVTKFNESLTFSIVVLDYISGHASSNLSYCPSGWSADRDNIAA